MSAGPAQSAPGRVSRVSRWTEHAFDLVKDGVDEGTGGVAAGEVEAPAVAGELAADGQAVAGGEGAAGAGRAVK